MTVKRTGECGMSGRTLMRDFAFKIIQIVAEGIPVPILVVDIFVQHPAQIGDQDFARFRLAAVPASRKRRSRRSRCS